MTAPHIVVVGSGLAGLRAALACQARGARVSVLEARSLAGGATWSRIHRGLGFEIDNGQHVFMRCCEAYRSFLSLLGVDHHVQLQPRLSVPVFHAGAGRSLIRRSPLPAPAHLLPSLLRFAGLRPAERLRAIRIAAGIASLDPDSPSLDDQAMGQWLTDRGASPAQIDGLWNLLIRPTLNLDVAEASLATALKVLRTGFLDSSDGADIGVSRIPLGRLHAEPAIRLLERGGGRVHLRSRVHEFAWPSTGGVEVRTSAGGLLADGVILATPPLAAADLLARSGERATSRRMASLGASPIVNLHLVFDRRIFHCPFGVVTDSPLEWIFDRSERLGDGPEQYLTVSLSAADRWLGTSQARLRACFEAELRRIFPDARDARLLGFAVTIERQATDRPTPGSRSLRPEPGASPLPGVFMAGAYTRTGWPSTMESAVRRGEAAAQHALDHVFEIPIRNECRAKRRAIA